MVMYYESGESCMAKENLPIKDLILYPMRRDLQHYWSVGFTTLLECRARGDLIETLQKNYKWIGKLWPKNVL